MNQSSRRTTALAAAALVTLVAGCGGGGGGGDDTAPPAAIDAVPASASRSVGGMWDYLLALTKTQPQDREALDVSAFAPPRADDSEPSALN